MQKLSLIAKKGEKKCKVAFFLEQDSISQHNGCNYQIFVWKLSCLLHCILGGFKLPNHVFQSALNSIGSAIMSKLAHQMSNIWIEFAGPISETIRKFDRQKNWVPNYSDKSRNMMKSVWTQNMSSRCTSSTVGKIKIFSQSYFAWLAENSPCNWNKIQIISECPYEIIVSPIRPTKYFQDFCPSLWGEIKKIKALYYTN